jgi:hypothetical protein
MSRIHRSEVTHLRRASRARVVEANNLFEAQLGLSQPEQRLAGPELSVRKDGAAHVGYSDGKGEESGVTASLEIPASTVRGSHDIEYFVLKSLPSLRCLML